MKNITITQNFMLIPMQKNVFDFNQYILRYKLFIKSNGNGYLYLAFLAHNGEETVEKRSEIFWER